MRLTIIAIDGEIPIVTVTLWKTGEKRYSVPLAFLAIILGDEPEVGGVYEITATPET